MTLFFPAGLPEGLFSELCREVGRSLDAGEPLDAVAVEALGVDYEAAFSVRSQMHMRRVKRTAARVRQDLSRLKERWLRGESVLSLSRSVGYPPYLLMRMVLEAVCGVSRARVSDMVKRPQEPSRDGKSRRRGDCARSWRWRWSTTWTTTLPRTARAASWAPSTSSFCSGSRGRGVAFESEDELRTLGLAKTPDVRLGIPLGVRDPRSGEWREVNWIDSKAMFGDPHTFAHEHLAQLEGYVHRYGPGMVVYWFGFAAALADPAASGDLDVVVAAEFPAEILFPAAEAATELPLRVRCS